MPCRHVGLGGGARLRPSRLPLFPDLERVSARIESEKTRFLPPWDWQPEPGVRQGGFAFVFAARSRVHATIEFPAGSQWSSGL